MSQTGDCIAACDITTKRSAQDSNATWFRKKGVPIIEDIPLDYVGFLKKLFDV